MPSVSIPIIDQLVHPSLGLLTRAAVAGNPQSGFVALAPPQNPLIALTYGVVIELVTVPSGFGRRGVFPVIFENNMVVIASHYRDLSGLDIIRQVEFVKWTQANYFWQEPLPLLVTFDITPDVTVNLFWLQT